MINEIISKEEEAEILAYLAYLRGRIAAGIFDDFDRDIPVKEAQRIIDNGLKQ